MVYKPLLLGDYIRWQMDKAPPFNMTKSQAVCQWHKDLQNPKLLKTTKDLYNPTSGKVESFTRVHVAYDELQHRKEVEEHGKIFEKSSGSKAPTAGVLKEMKDRFNQEARF